MLSAAAMVAAGFAGWARPLGGRALLWPWPWCSTRRTGGWPGCKARARPSAAGSTRCSTSWPTWCCTRRSPGPPFAATASRAGCCSGMLYASSKYLFQVQSLLGEELEGEMQSERRTPAGPLHGSASVDGPGLGESAHGPGAFDRPRRLAVASLDRARALGPARPGSGRLRVSTSRSGRSAAAVQEGGAVCLSRASPS